MRIVTSVPLAGAALETLKDNGYEVLYDVALKNLKGAEAILMEEAPDDPAFYDRLQDVKLIALFDADAKGLDIERITALGIRILTSARGVAASVADYALLEVLKAARDQNRPGGPVELSGKALGLYGFGESAAEIAKRARGFGMRVYCYDRNLSRGKAMRVEAEPMPAVDLFVLSDFIVISENMSSERAPIGKDMLQLMRKDATLIVLAAPHVFITDELLRALEWGYLTRLSMDLPYEDAALINALKAYGHHQITVGKARNTNEAKEAIFLEMTQAVLRNLSPKAFPEGINVPLVKRRDYAEVKRWMYISAILGRILGQRLPSAPQKVAIKLGGAAKHLPKEALVQAFLASFAQGMGEQISYVNAQLWQKEQGFHFDISTERGLAGMQVSVENGKRRYSASGSLRQDEVVITEIDDYLLDVRPSEHVFLVPHINRPGMVGLVGTLLGDAKTNISGMVLGHRATNMDAALMWVRIDDAPCAEVVAGVGEKPNILSSEYLYLPEAKEGEFLCWI